MSEPFLAEVKIFGFNFPPRGWAQCDGQILPINQNQSLFSLLGTTFGGDGRTSFALPDLRGRTPMHVGTSSAGNSAAWGQRAGEETHALTVQEMPSHDHGAVQGLTASGRGAPPTVSSPAGALPSNAAGGRRPVLPYGAPGTPAPGTTTLAGNSVGNAGSNQGHNNMQPFLALNFCIAIQGLFPPRN